MSHFGKDVHKPEHILKKVVRVVHVFRCHANFQEWKVLNTSFSNVFFIVRMHLDHKDLPFIPFLSKAPSLIKLRSSITFM